MKKFIIIMFVWFTSLSAFAGSGENNVDNSIVKKVSPYSVIETMDKFESIIKKKGFDVFARIDHKKNAQAVDMKLNDAQVIIFGNPKGGTVLMKQDINIALDLPLRVAVYQDADNKVYIAYHNPIVMAAAYQLKNNKVIPKVTMGLDKLTSAAIAKQ